jgi:hypothetical protein
MIYDRQLTPKLPFCWDSQSFRQGDPRLQIASQFFEHPTIIGPTTDYGQAYIDRHDV